MMRGRIGGKSRPGKPNGLDRSSFVPLYFQLAEILKERIEAGQWQAEDRFPSESQLSSEFGISRTVIRPALALLESDGQLVRIKGRGTFVSPPKRTVRIAGLSRLLSHALADDLELRIVEAREQAPEALVADVLGKGQARVTHVTAIGLVRGRPQFICDSFSRPDDVPWLPTALQRQRAVPPGSAPMGSLRLSHTEAQLDVAYVSSWEATQLELPVGQNCYLIRAVEHAFPRRGRNPRAIELARLVYPVDAVQFSLLLGSSEG
jgi:GntR family transcriptional regulator